MSKQRSDDLNSAIRTQIMHRAQAINVGKPLFENWISLHHIAALGGMTVEQLLADGEGEAVLAWLAATEEGAFS